MRCFAPKRPNSTRSRTEQLDNKTHTFPLFTLQVAEIYTYNIQVLILHHTQHISKLYDSGKTILIFLNHLWAYKLLISYKKFKTIT